MKRILLFCLFPLFMVSCLPKQGVMTNNLPPNRPAPNKPGSTRPIERAPNAPSGAKSVTAIAYIEQYKGIAIQEMNQYGIPASIKLAQALLESGNGNSSLARQGNNHFGIKCSSGWSGKKMFKDDDAINDCFRVYSRPEESFRDHSEFLLRKRYEALFDLDKNDYVGWAQGLKRAGYATNPRYPELLISLIERYQLSQYDAPESRREKVVREEKVHKEIRQNIPNDAKDAIAKPPVTLKIHEVKKGETLFAISSKYGLSVENLKSLNNIKSDSVAVGQLLLVSNQ